LPRVKHFLSKNAKFIATSDELFLFFNMTIL